MNTLLLLILLAQAGATLVPGTTSTYTDGTHTWAGNPWCAEEGFLLQPTSPAIDKGVVNPGVQCPAAGPSSQFPANADGSPCAEWYGLAPDIGTCEYVSGAIPPPQVGDLIPKSQVQVVSATTDAANAPLVSDGDLDTKWVLLAAPNSLVLDLGGHYSVSGIQYDSTWTAVGAVQLSVGAGDPAPWVPAYSGVLPVGARVNFAPVAGRYVMLTVLDLPTGYGYVSELSVFGVLTGQAVPNAPVGFTVK